MNRLHQLLLIGSFVSLSWLGVQAAHELGHVAAGLLTGGPVARVVLHPLTISRTDVEGGSWPLLVVWGGPLVGVLLPVVLLAILKASRAEWAYVARFFAGFCLIANGAYLGIGWIQGVGDAGDLIRLGSPKWLLVLFGAIAFPLGLFLWNGLGPKFGLGPSAGAVDRRVAYVSCGLLLLVVILEATLSSR